MIERHSKVFMPVSVSVRLPELTENYGMESKVVPILINMETYSSENGARHWGDKEFVTFPSTPTSAYYTKDGWYTEWGDNLILAKGEEITHWLEEKENVYVLTEQELFALIIEKNLERSEKKVTPMEQKILNILSRDCKEKLSIEIAEAYNHITGKNYNRKDMSSTLTKMAKKKLIICRKESDSKVAKLLWSLPLMKDSMMWLMLLKDFSNQKLTHKQKTNE